MVDFGNYVAKQSFDNCIQLLRAWVAGEGSSGACGALRTDVWVAPLKRNRGSHQLKCPTLVPGMWEGCSTTKTVRADRDDF